MTEWQENHSSILFGAGGNDRLGLGFSKNNPRRNFREKMKKTFVGINYTRGVEH